MRSIKSIKLAVARRFNIFFARNYGQIGTKSIIYKPISICGKKNIFLGDNILIRENARIEVLSNWNGDTLFPKLKIDSNTSFEQGAKIICTTNLEIGNNCVFSYNVFISTAHHEYKEISKNVLKQPLINKPIKIGNYCFIGMDVKIFPGVTIGDNVIVGTNSIVINNLPSYTVCTGIPAKPIKKYNFTTKCWEKINEY